MAARHENGLLLPLKADDALARRLFLDASRLLLLPPSLRNRRMQRRERLPHEYNGGSCLTRDRGAVKDEGLDGPAIAQKKEKILIFADSTGICPKNCTSYWSAIT